MKHFRPIDLALCGLFICLMAIGANIAVWFPMLVIPIGGATVPLSLQTFFAVICGFILGKKRGSVAMTAYLLIGSAGIPIFSKMLGGPMVLIYPTGGFIISFIAVSYVTGWMAERNKTHTIRPYIFAAFIGVIVNYMIGVTYMYVMMNTWMNIEISYSLAWSGMIPFFLKDGALSMLAAMFTVRLHRRLPSQLGAIGIISSVKFK